MNLLTVITEIEAALDTITPLHVLVVGEKLAPPAAYVAWPGSIEFDKTYGRGSDAIELQAVLVVGRTVDRAIRKDLAAYCAGSGASSVKAAVDGYAYTEADSVTVTGVEFDVVENAGIDYIAALFSISVLGSGA